MRSGWFVVPNASELDHAPSELKPQDLRNLISAVAQPAVLPNFSFIFARCRAEPPGTKLATDLARKRLPAGSTIHQRPSILRTRKYPSGLLTCVPTQPPYSSRAGSAFGVKPGMRSTETAA